MNWYKQSQQLDLKLENQKQLKTDPNSVMHVIGVVAGMLFNDKVSDEVIRKHIKDLKDLKDKGTIKFPIGMAIYNNFDKVCKYQNIPKEEILDRKKVAFDRLRRIMEDLV
jgi:hypothetical protein